MYNPPRKVHDSITQITTYPNNQNPVPSLQPQFNQASQEASKNQDPPPQVPQNQGLPQALLNQNPPLQIPRN